LAKITAKESIQTKLAATSSFRMKKQPKIASVFTKIDIRQDNSLIALHISLLTAKTEVTHYWRGSFATSCKINY